MISIHDDPIRYILDFENDLLFLNQFIGKKIYDIDLRLLKNEIEKDLWIKYAQVSIEKPTTLIIKVIELRQKIFA